MDGISYLRGEWLAPPDYCDEEWCKRSDDYYCIWNENNDYIQEETEKV